MTWVGNLAGALLLSRCSTWPAVADCSSAPDALVMKVAAAKMNASGAEPVRARGAVQLARLPRALDGRARRFRLAKCASILWCLLAFIACGFEHSVANMTLLGLALAGNHPETVSIAGRRGTSAGSRSATSSAARLFVGGAY